MIHDVAAFGAVGDGVADDTAPIQDAIDAASALSGGTVYIPAGSPRYRITAPLTVDGAIRIIGDGGNAGALGQAGSTILQTMPDTSAFVMASGSQYTSFEGVAIFSDGFGWSAGCGIELPDGPSGFRLEVQLWDVWVQGFHTGMRLGDRTFYSKSFHSTFATATEACVYAAPGGNNADFFGCRFSGGKYGLDLRGLLGCEISGGSFEVSSIAGIRINGDSRAGQAAGHGAGIAISGVYFEHEDGQTDILIGDLSRAYGVVVQGSAFVKSGRVGSGWAIDGQDIVGLTTIGNEIDSSEAIRLVSGGQGVTINDRLRNGGTVSGMSSAGTGPPGPMGPQGPEGPQGPPGSGGYSEHVIDDGGAVPPVTIVTEDGTDWLYTG